MDEIVTYHQVVVLPLYKLSYDVIAGIDMKECIAHAETLYPGLKLPLDVSDQGHTIVVQHSELGKRFVVMINVTNQETLAASIVHEAVHMSWEVKNEVGITCTLEKNDSQAFIVEAIFNQVTHVVGTFINEHGGTAGSGEDFGKL